MNLIKNWKSLMVMIFISCWTIESNATSSDFYLSFTHGDSLWFYHDGRYFAGTIDNVQNSRIVDWDNNESSNGKIHSLNIEDFLYCYYSQICSAPVVLIDYSRTASSYKESLEFLKKFELEENHNFRVVDALQLACFENLQENGIWQVVYDNDTVYVDYTKEEYEFAMDVKNKIPHQLRISSRSNYLTLLLRASAKYFEGLRKQELKIEKIKFCTTFPIQLLEQTDSTVNSLCFVPQGYTCPFNVSSRFGRIIESTKSYYLFLDDSSSFITFNHHLIDPLLFDIDSIETGNYAICMDSTGIISIQNNNKDIEILDLFAYAEEDYYEDSDSAFSEEISREWMIALLFVFWAFVVVIGFLMYTRKEDAKMDIIKAKDKLEANNIRSSHDKTMKQIGLIGFPILIIFILLMYAQCDVNDIWKYVFGSSGVFVIGISISNYISGRKQGYESNHISTLTMKDVDLDKPYILYLRGFKQDDYRFGYFQTKEFNEERLFGAISTSIKSYAIGMTKELYAPMGAERIYFNDDEWKEGVKILINNAQVVIINIHNSENCIFEIVECNRCFAQTIYIATDEGEYGKVKELCLHVNTKLPSIEFQDKEMCFIYRDEKLTFSRYSIEQMIDFLKEFNIKISQ